MKRKYDYKDIAERYLSLVKHEGLIKDSKILGISYITLLRALKSVGEIPLLAKRGRKLGSHSSKSKPKKLTIQSYAELQRAIADRIKLKYQLPS